MQYLFVLMGNSLGQKLIWLDGINCSLKLHKDSLLFFAPMASPLPCILESVDSESENSLLSMRIIALINIFPHNNTSPSYFNLPISSEKKREVNVKSGRGNFII